MSSLDENLRLLDLPPHRGQIPRSVGVLNSKQLKELPRWRLPGDGELASYEIAWQAVSSPSPQALIAFCAQDALHPAQLRQALRAFLARYPAVETGLTYWDRLILSNCEQHGPMAARIIGYTMSHDVQYPDWPGDIYLFDRIKRLSYSRLAHRLLALTGDHSAIRFVEATITEMGRKVLAGKANHVALNGIDDWVGGVHLKARSGSPWLFDGQTLVPGDTA